MDLTSPFSRSLPYAPNRYRISAEGRYIQVLLAVEAFPKKTQTTQNSVIQHLTAITGAGVRITLEIEADLPDGATDELVRTVSENCRTLRFTSQGFEEQ